MHAALDAPATQTTTAANQVRQNVKWLIAAFAAVGAALAAGIQISNLGGVQSGGRLTAAFVGAALGLVGIIVAIWQAGKVLDLQQATTADLTTSTLLRKRLEEEPAFLGGYGHESPAALVKDYERLLGEVRRAERATRQKPDDKAAAVRLASVSAEFDGLSNAVDFLRKVVIYEHTQARYVEARPRIVGAAILTFSGLALFAYAANPPARVQKPEVNQVIVRSTSTPGPRGPRGLRGPIGPPGHCPTGPNAPDTC
jgi:hypothetical protein